MAPAYHAYKSLRESPMIDGVTILVLFALFGSAFALERVAGRMR